MEAAQLLDSILKKKWLSSNTVREGLIACFTLTLLNYAKQASLSRLGLELGGTKAASPDEAAIYSKVLQTSQEGFRTLDIDDEYPTKDQIMKLKTIMEECLGFAKLKEDNPALMDQYNSLASTLLSKLE
jgi:hypothetical protein